MEKIIKKASIAGQIIEDLSFEGLNPSRFKVMLNGERKNPFYKDDGYFVFSGLQDGNYLVLIEGERFQPLIYPLTIPELESLPLVET